MTLLHGVVGQVPFPKVSLGYSELRTQVSAVRMQTQRRMKLSPTFWAQLALQTVLKPSNRFILSLPHQAELPEQRHPRDLVYTSSAEFEDPILLIALAIRILCWAHEHMPSKTFIVSSILPFTHQCDFSILRNVEANNCCHDGVHGSVLLTSWLYLYSSSVVFYSCEGVLFRIASSLVSKVKEFQVNV